ncbi:MAG: NosD domain-containing protein, partial [Candidatus Paceibacterota bacterium]
MLRSIILLAVLVFLMGGGGFVTNAEAATNISTNINADTTWTAADGPYHITKDIMVQSGVTLTIEAGTVVKLGSPRMITVDGSLVAIGNETGPIYFTSIHDDSVGGDSNANGTSTKPAPGDWRTIEFRAGSTGVLENVHARYAGYSRFSIGPLPAIYNNGGIVNVRNSRVTDNSYFGVGQLSGNLTIKNSVIDNNQIGIAIKDGEATLSNNRFENNSYGLVADGDDSLDFDDNEFIGGYTAVTLLVIKGRSISHTGNQASGSYRNGVLLRGPVEGEINLAGGDSMPYIVQEVGGSDNGATPLSFKNLGGLTVSSSGKLDFGAGSVIKMDGMTGIDVGGVLNVTGDSENPVVFTSIYDNSVGGPTWDKDSTAPSPKNWGDIRLVTESMVTLDGVEIRYAGESRFNSNAAVFNQGGILDIRNSVINHDQGIGLKHQSGNSTIRNSSIAGGSFTGVVNNSTEPLSAVLNYWGHASGPRHSTNPGGQGSKVTDNVLFDPWLASYPSAEVNTCCSSVLFLPGIMSSQLYEGGDKRWEPSGEGDVERLYLDENGKSKHSIIAGNVISTFNGPAVFNSNIYKSFLNDLEAKKQAGFLADYKTYGYDWRLSLQDILADEILASELR